MSKFTCQSALITGASSGIGAAFARELARPGCRLILTARRLDRLQALATELEEKGAKVEPLAADLATEAGIQTVVAKIAAEPGLDLLVNNAGFGVVGPFASAPVPALADMLRVHTEAPFLLTHAALQNMLPRKKGAIINVTSISAFISSGNGVMYAATKSYQASFSAALAKSLKHSGVKVQALCPGFTHTEFHVARPNMDMDISRIPGFMWLDAGRVARASLRALNGPQVIVVPGLIYKISVFMGRLGLV